MLSVVIMGVVFLVDFVGNLRSDEAARAKRKNEKRDTERGK